VVGRELIQSYLNISRTLYQYVASVASVLGSPVLESAMHSLRIPTSNHQHHYNVEVKEMLDILANCLFNSPSEISIESKPISNYAAKVLAEALRKNHSIKSLSLVRCNIKDEGAIALARSVSHGICKIPY